MRSHIALPPRHGPEENSSTAGVRAPSPPLCLSNFSVDREEKSLYSLTFLFILPPSRKLSEILGESFCRPVGHVNRKGSGSADCVRTGSRGKVVDDALVASRGRREPPTNAAGDLTMNGGPVSHRQFRRCPG